MTTGIELGLGTEQFGLAYGVACHGAPVSTDDEDVIDPRRWAAQV